MIALISGTSGNAMFGPLPRNRRRRYTLTIEATAGDETIVSERRFRSGVQLYIVKFNFIILIITLYNRNYW